MIILNVQPSPSSALEYGTNHNVLLLVFDGQHLPQHHKTVGSHDCDTA